MTDVIVAGGGPAGALAAIILARAGARVRVFERARFPRHKLCGDTLNPGALRALDAYVPIEPILARSLPLDGMLLTGPGGVAVRGRYRTGLEGRAIPRTTLDVMLVRHAVDAGVQFDDGVSVHGATCDARGHVMGISVKGANGETQEHRTRMVIAADGRESRLARQLNLLHHPVQADLPADGVALAAGVSSSGVAVGNGMVIVATGNSVVAYTP